MFMTRKITLAEALMRLKELDGKKVSDYVTPDLINKGSAGQAIEKAIGIDLSSDLLDFHDGELKSNKFLNGQPAETLAVTQVGHSLAEIMISVSWQNSLVKRKINSFIFLPIHKDSTDPMNWIIGKAVHFEDKQFPIQYQKLAEDYESVSKQIKSVIENGKTLHTLNGPHEYLQIRTKDSKRKNGDYNPITYDGRRISNKNYAFYIRKGFLNDILSQ
jgi:DNA mismatch repair protein MutH